MKSGGGGFGIGLSLWLDLVRMCAALTVLVYHATNLFFLREPATQSSGGWFKLGTLGPDAVFVFFVLSGLVITYVADTKERSVSLYASSRLARLWSVLIPALLLTYVADRIGLLIDHSQYEGWNDVIVPEGSPWRLLASALFVNELWFTSIVPLSNSPVWSIGFEFWYYVIFAASIFLLGKARWIAIVVIAMVAGPRILLLFPTWLLGVAVYKVGSRVRLSQPVGWALFFMPPVILGAFYLTRGNHAVGGYGAAFLALLGSPEHWRYCEYFLWDYVVAVAVGAHLLGAWHFTRPLGRLLRPVGGLIRVLADLTLSIYLFHLPLLLAFSAALSQYPAGAVRNLLVTGATLVVCTVLGVIFERQKVPLRRWLLSLEDIPMTWRHKLMFRHHDL